MNKLRVFVSLLTFFVFLSSSTAQDNGTDTPLPNVGSYSIIVLNSEIGNNIYFFTQGRIHHYDLYDNQKQFLVRAAIEYKFSKLFKIHLGFASVDLQPFDKSLMDEFAIQKWVYDEFVLSLGTPDKLQLKTRFRHERRWITPSNQVDTYMDDRLRLRLTLVKDLGSGFYAKLFSEGFYSIKNKELSKLRNNLTFGTRLSKELKFEAGVIDEGKIGESSTYVVSRLYINTSWRNKEAEKNKTIKDTPTPIVFDTVKEAPKEILFDTNHKLNNIIDQPIEKIQEDKKEAAQQEQQVKIPEQELDDEISEEVDLEEVIVYSQELRHNVIVAAHTEKESTVKTLDRLIRDGYNNGKVLEISENGYYRVSAQEYKVRDQAELSRQNLASIGYIKPWILSTTTTVTTVEMRPVKKDSIVAQEDELPIDNKDVDQVFDKESNLMDSDIVNIQNQDTELLQRISAQRETSGKRKFKSPIYHLVVGAVTELGYAPKHLEALRSKGYRRAYVFKKPYRGLYRISASKSKNVEDLQNLIPQLKADGFKYAWIFDTTLIDYEEDLNTSITPTEPEQTPSMEVQSENTAVESDTLVLTDDSETVSDTMSETIEIIEETQAPIEDKVEEVKEPVQKILSKEDNSFERNSDKIPYRPVYHVIAASTKNLDNANSILQKIRSQGFVNAFIIESDTNDYYRISAAHFKKETDTEAAIDLLEKQGYKGTWVLIEN